MEQNYKTKASEYVKKIVASIKEQTAMTAYKLEILPNSTPDIFDSKFGGVPYWDMEKEYPIDGYGKKMMLLAQINFTKAKLEDERLPKQGMLQFFLASDDDIFGMDCEGDATSQKNFRVIYHESINLSVTKEQVLSLDIPLATEDDTQSYSECSPLYKEAKVEIRKTIASMGVCDYRFDKVFAETVKNVLGEEIQDMDAYDYLCEADREYLFEELYPLGHWILGYPYFTQFDPRSEEDAYFDTLLFQMDSDMVDGEDYVLWGDCGVANFFINSEALKNKDFGKVLYNWDCC